MRAVIAGASTMAGKRSSSARQVQSALARSPAAAWICAEAAQHCFFARAAGPQAARRCQPRDRLRRLQLAGREQQLGSRERGLDAHTDRPVMLEHRRRCERWRHR
jgi:hypothetical protein